MEDCIFCKMVSGEILVEKIYENENFFSILDAKPKIEGHTLVISKKHLLFMDRAWGPKNPRPLLLCLLFVPCVGNVSSTRIRS